MIGLLCFVLAVLASPFKSKVRLEAKNAVLSASVDCFAAQAAWPCPTRKQRRRIGPGDRCPARLAVARQALKSDPRRPYEGLQSARIQCLNMGTWHSSTGELMLTLQTGPGKGQFFRAF